MDNGININISNGITLGRSEVIERVRKLLSIIPKAQKGNGYQMFYSLNLISPEGNRFALSMQGSDGHYSEPRSCLANLASYEAVEVGINPDKSNKTDRFRFGTTYDWVRNSGRHQVQDGELNSMGRPKRGWLMPSDIGFTRVEDAGPDDVLGWVPVDDLVADLADFFMRGGAVDGDHKVTKEWLSKVQEKEAIINHAKETMGSKSDSRPTPGGPDDWNYFSFGN